MAGEVTLLAGGHAWRGRGADPALAEALRMADGHAPRVAYIGAANGDDVQFRRWGETVLRGAGAGEILNVALMRGGSAASVAAALARAEVVFLSGGDVEAGMAAVHHRGVGPRLRELHAAGVPFIGVSAGSIMLGSFWVRWRSPNDDATAAPFACLGLAPCLCDTHAEEDDWVEIKLLLRLLGAGHTGYALPSGCGIRIAADGQVKPVGGPVWRMTWTESGVSFEKE
jgi:peptidase E